MNLQIAFRTDASLDIGTGHVMRCLTLADALRERGADCTFVCRPHAGHLLDTVAQRGHRALALPMLDACVSTSPSDLAHAAWLGTDWQSDARDTAQALEPLGPLDTLVVDHYALDARWEQHLRPLTHTLMAIDDLADRPHDCDLLLDQTFGRLAKDYAALVPSSCQLLCGSHYALLRPEFAALRPYSLQRRVSPVLRELLITMGGVDQGNVTGRVLQILSTCSLRSDSRITVVLGQTAPWKEKVREQVQNMRWETRILSGLTEMAQLMADSDLAIGASGATTWERCCLGLPSMMVVLAANQQYAAEQLSTVNAVKILDLNASFPEKLRRSIDKLTSAGALLQELSERSRKLTDGLGLQRVLDKLINKVGK